MIRQKIRTHIPQAEDKFNESLKGKIMPLITLIDNDVQPCLLNDCVIPSIIHTALFAGVARAFTTINPMAAAVTGALVPIIDFVLDKIVPDLHSDDNANTLLRYTITRISGYILGTAAANAAGFSISLPGVLGVSLLSNALGIGVVFVIAQIASRFFSQTSSTIENALDPFIQQAGQFVICVGGGILFEACLDLCPSAANRNSSSQNEE
jgi:hypothetical protein